MCTGRLGSNTGRMITVGALGLSDRAVLNRKVSKEEFVSLSRRLYPADNVGIRVRMKF